MASAKEEEEKSGEHDHNENDENSNLARDLEIEAFSTSTQSINVEKCIELLNKVQEVHDKTTAERIAIQRREKSLQNELLEHQIILEKAILKNNENSRILSRLKKDQSDAQSKYEACKEAEKVSQEQYQIIEPLHQDLQKQCEDIQSLNQEIVAPEFEKRRLELEVLVEESKASKKEIQRTKMLLDELNVQYNDAESSYESAVLLLKEKDAALKETQDEAKAAETKKQIAQAEKEVIMLEEELGLVQKEIAESKEKVLEEDSKMEETEKVQGNLISQLEEIQVECNLVEDEVASLTKSLSVAQSQCHSYATTRMQLEIDLREVNESFRHENASVVLHRKQLDRMKRLYLKKKRIVEKTVELIKEMKISLDENLQMIETQESENKEQIVAIEGLKDDMNIKITRLMEQQNIEEGVKEEFEGMNNALEEEESEIDRWRIEVKKLSKIVTILGIQHEAQMRKTRNLVSNEKETLEMLKLKNLVVMDMRKALHETKKRAKEFAALYEILKGEKNEIQGAITATASALVEIRKKVQDHKMTLQNLHQSQELKKMILIRERDAHDISKVNRANLRVEKTKIRAEYRRSREQADRCVLRIAKLKSTLAGLQKESSRLKSRNGRLENGKRMIAEQLDDKKVEIHTLLQRANAYEEALKRGELAIQEKKEDIKALRLQCADIERHVSVKKKLTCDINTYKDKIASLEGELDIQRKQVQHLSKQIEDPMQSNRWNELGGEDLDDEQLDAKINILQQRLSEGKEQLLEREVMLEEIKANTSELQLNIKIANEKTQPIVNRLNDYQTRLREVTRSMMALVSELSMYQAIALKLNEEKEQEEEALRYSRSLVTEGKPPSDDALRDLKRLLNIRKKDLLSNSDNVDDGLGHVYYPAPYALRTTAEPRPTAYIPDTGIEIPKPYGSMAPFKPSDCSSTTMRRIRPP